jgi:hypothetical protein
VRDQKHLKVGVNEAAAQHWKVNIGKVRRFQVRPRLLCDHDWISQQKGEGQIVCNILILQSTCCVV